MAKLNKTTEPQQNPEDLVQVFAACPNFPKERAGVLALAQALKRASDDYRIPMQEIVQQCGDISSYCPTPRDIRSVSMGMRESLNNRRANSQEARWEKIYGPAQKDWSNDLIGCLSTDSPEAKLRAIHIRAVRDTLYYTEGEGKGHGDIAFWEGDHSNYGAKNANNDKYPELVAQVRAAGGWRTERELQMDWIDIPWEVPAKKRSKAAEGAAR